MSKNRKHTRDVRSSSICNAAIHTNIDILVTLDQYRDECVDITDDQYGNLARKLTQKLSSTRSNSILDINIYMPYVREMVRANAITAKNSSCEGIVKAFHRFHLNNILNNITTVHHMEEYLRYIEMVGHIDLQVYIRVIRQTMSKDTEIVLMCLHYVASKLNLALSNNCTVTAIWSSAALTIITLSDTPDDLKSLLYTGAQEYACAFTPAHNGLHALILMHIQMGALDQSYALLMEQPNYSYGYDRMLDVMCQQVNAENLSNIITFTRLGCCSRSGEHCFLRMIKCMFPSEFAFACKEHIERHPYIVRKNDNLTMDVNSLVSILMDAPQTKPASDRFVSIDGQITNVVGLPTNMIQLPWQSIPCNGRFRPNEIDFGNNDVIVDGLNVIRNFRLPIKTLNELLRAFAKFRSNAIMWIVVTQEMIVGKSNYMGIDTYMKNRCWMGDNAERIRFIQVPSEKTRWDDMYWVYPALSHGIPVITNDTLNNENHRDVKNKDRPWPQIKYNKNRNRFHFTLQAPSFTQRVYWFEDATTRTLFIPTVGVSQIGWGAHKYKAYFL
uniref:PRORP domain-containing protein n=1 Tax=Megaviridae environmental sample TaxID=1737588 RepID=A0A5J6VJ45_9VIRU|nr:MAG: hypothetical protein [Megaviridae environmental sample]